METSRRGLHCTKLAPRLPLITAVLTPFGPMLIVMGMIPVTTVAPSAFAILASDYRSPAFATFVVFAVAAVARGLISLPAALKETQTAE